MFEIWLTPSIRDLLWSGLQLTVLMTLITGTCALLLSIIMAWIQQQAWGRAIASVYVEVFRNIPALILVIIFAYGVPNFFELETRRSLFFQSDVMLWLRELSGLAIPYYAVAAGVALTLNTSAYLTRLLQAGMNALDSNHLDAARTLGVDETRLFFRIMLPHALATASPTIITRLVHHLKNTALASFVAVPELFKAGQSAISQTFHAIEILILVALLYLILSWLWATLLSLLLPSIPTAKAHQ